MTETAGVDFLNFLIRLSYMISWYMKDQVIMIVHLKVIDQLSLILPTQHCLCALHCVCSTSEYLKEENSVAFHSPHKKNKIIYIYIYHQMHIQLVTAIYMCVYCKNLFLYKGRKGISCPLKGDKKDILPFLKKKVLNPMDQSGERQRGVNLPPISFP